VLGISCRRELLRPEKIGHRRPGLFIVALVAAALTGSACGTSELDVEPTFDGTWRVTTLQVDDTAVDLQGQALQIEIDTGQAAVRGRTNCQELFGSYTLVDTGASSGEASFTIPSPAADPSCEAVDASVHRLLVEALESVTLWRREGSTLTFLGTAPSPAQGQTELALIPAG
jgi:hypothetical protein